jgi:putative glutathione S-transferase
LGLLIEGYWHEDEDAAKSDTDGRWQRTPSSFRDWIEVGGEHPPAPTRYHLYAAWNCPWAHRALLARTFKNLKDLLSVSFVAPRRTSEGWVFDPSKGFKDDLFGSQALHEIYTHSDPKYSGRVTVPVLWDKETGTAVSNESAEIVRMLNTAFTEWAQETSDLYPEHLRERIDEWNDLIHPRLNNGVYRAGFASTQEAYYEAVADVFNTLDFIEAHLSEHRFLAGDTFTEADLRLFPTLVRFDVGYFTAFKCIRNRLIDFPKLWDYAKRLYSMPGFATTVKFDIYRRGYNSPSVKRNPLGIVPEAPLSEWV